MQWRKVIVMGIGIHVNTVNVDELWVSYDIENAKTVDKKGQKEERVYLVANFTKAGERIYTISNLGGADEIAKLLDREYAKKKALEMIEQTNKSAHSPFLK